MKLLGEIICCDDLNYNGKIYYREAVRGIISAGRTLLMIYSPVNGDYKFPGGGVETGETFADALLREIQEECGVCTAAIIRPYGKVLEYDEAFEPDHDLFKMTSSYYFCCIEGERCEQVLDDYEQDLEFQPVWIDVDAAIAANRIVLADRTRPHPRWTRRETFVLDLLSKELH